MSGSPSRHRTAEARTSMLTAHIIGRTALVLALAVLACLPGASGAAARGLAGARSGPVQAAPTCSPLPCRSWGLGTGLPPSAYLGYGPNGQIVTPGQWNALTGVTAPVFETSLTWGSPVNTTWLNAVSATGAVPFIGLLCPSAGCPAVDAAFDSAAAALAKSLVAYNGPILISWDAE